MRRDERTRGVRRERIVRRRGIFLVAPLVLAGGFVASCGGGQPMIHTHAAFSEVGSLISGAPVDMEDVPIGTVTAVSLAGGRARVDMALDQGARVPRDVTAQVRVTTILGQDFVELVPSHADVAAVGTGRPVALLANGEPISHAEVIPGIQQLVQYGTAAFGAVDASQLAQLIATEAQGFGNQSQSIRQLLNGFSTTAQGYATQGSTIVSLVNEMNQLSSSLAPSANSDAGALSNLARTTDVLAQQSQTFENLLQGLDGLAVSSRSILDNFVPDISTDFGTLDAISQAIVARLGDLGGIIAWLPAHNQALKEGVVGGYLQILDDMVVCGLPNGGEQNNPAGTCNGAH